MRNHQAVDEVFDALGEPVRRTILELLAEGPQPVGRLAERLPVGRPAVSKHLQVLSRAGLVQHESRGTRNLYALAPAGMVAAQQWLVATWDTVLGDFASAVREVTDHIGTGQTPPDDGARPSAGA
jgi:DNA-binding transcriptional ArsR family regulator